MKIKVFVSVYVVLFELQVGYGQNKELRCNYTVANSQYACNLKIYNPNGYDSFGTIIGTHLDRKSDLEVLQLKIASGSNSKIVPVILCNRFRNLHWIDFRNTGIQKIDVNYFRSCKELKHLEIEDNKIREINEKSFIENLKLKNLYLGHNQLTSLPENIFANQHELTVLWMDNNKISDLPDNIFKPLRKLISLSLAENQIYGLKVEWFETLANLEHLWIDSNQIEELPENIFSPLKKLQQITMQNNKLKIINSNSFSIHQNMQVIYAENNQIDAIDKEFIRNTGLLKFNMENNTCINKNILSRASMHSELQICFDNFENLISSDVEIITLPSETATFVTTLQTLSPECSDQDLAFRVCKIENKNAEFHKLQEENKQLKLANEGVDRRIQELSNKNEMLLLEIRSLKEDFNERDVSLNNLIKNIENKLIEKISRQCACR